MNEAATERQTAIANIEKYFAEQPQVFSAEFMDVCHHLQGGIYTRAGKIPAGHVCVGTIHRTKNILHLAKGKMLVWNSENGAVQVFNAPCSAISQPGVRRIAVALEDCEGCNLMETTAENWEQAESEMFFPMTLPDRLGETILQLNDAFQNL